MATTANLPPGATPANGGNDPFTSTSHAAAASMRFAPFDTEQHSLYASSSPSQAKRALEAHLKDTDRRIQDASRLGTTLVQQRKDLAARLKDVELVKQDNEVPDDLRKKLADLEKEYNEVGKESARAFLPKSKAGSPGMDTMGTPSAFTGSGRESPTKMTAPSRRQRNQPSNRVHDIEFATEISTSLLAQVRQLQGALAEKDEVLKDTTATNAQLEAEAAGMVQRIKHMDENEQRYKDENWNLETRLQELEASFKGSTDKEQRLGQILQATQSEKAAAQRDLDDLKVSHEKLSEEHAVIKKQQETDLNGLRRDAALHETDKAKLQKKIEELTSQNTELAKAVSYRWNQPSTATDTDFVSADEDQHAGDSTPENSEPASPVKGTPRHGMLESETLKSSLNHAHRMIQNLKNNIHREKTEKIELKRMLQDARDELETRRSESGAAGGKLATKRKSEQDSIKFRKPARPDRLGANRSSTTEIMEDEPDWEDHEGTPSKSRNVSAALGGAAAGIGGIAVLDHAFGDDDTESTDAAFETATEREGTTTDAFETGREGMSGDDSDELTETEGGVNRTSTVRAAPLIGAKARDRRSIQSTASTSADEDDDEIRTPIQGQQPKYRLRMNNRGSRRGRVSDLMEASPGQESPASSTGTPQPAGQSLGDELDALDEGSVEGTPSRLTDSAAATPETQRQVSVQPETPRHEEDEEPEIGSPVASPEPPVLEGEEANLAHQSNAAMLAHERFVTKPTYADAGVMTDPWEPEAAPVAKTHNLPEAGPVAKTQGLRERAGEVVGGALAGFGLGRFTGSKGAEEPEHEQADGGAEAERDVSTPSERPLTAVGAPEPKSLQSPELIPSKLSTPASLLQSGPVLQETKPPSSSQLRNIEALAPLSVEADRKQQQEGFAFSPIVAQNLAPEGVQVDTRTPMTPLTPQLPKRSSRRVLPWDEDTENQGFGAETIPGTNGSRVGAGFFSSSHARNRSQSMPPRERSMLVAEDGTSEPVEEPKVHLPTGLRPPSLSRNNTVSKESLIPVPAPLQVKKPMADEGSQTVVSGDDIEDMMRNKNTVPIAEVALGAVTGAAAGAAITDASTSPGRPSTAIGPNKARRSIDGATSTDSTPIRAPRRPASAGSMRNKTSGAPPPLPEDYTQRITAASKTPGTVGTMGPPTMPASAYKHNKPRTPTEVARTLSKDGTTPRPARANSNQMQSPSMLSGRTSMSSFASELDDRFNINRAGLMYPEGVQPATDPRMIQAITQTMIGEYLWKYTRKAGRSETSTTRHRRFFWIHPYTRTLYWSEKDPSTAGRDMLKAKSVAIDAVRVITDDNTYPPGLHRKSLVVVTPGRDIVFTAPTGQRHETWFNALSYLLLRTEKEKTEGGDQINQEDIDEFNPGFGNTIRRTVSRISGSRVSLSSYNSRTTRNSSPQRAQTGTSPQKAQTGNSLAQRQAAAAARAKAPQTPTPNPTGTATSRYSTMRDSNASRLSSLTSRFMPTSGQRGSYSTAQGRSSTMSTTRGRTGGESDIYDASVAADSAEDLRAVIEQQEHDAHRLENVRACCDGKHDVGSLSHKGRHSSLGSRFGSYSARHSHAHPRAAPPT